jgi:hypothetical protein
MKRFWLLLSLVILNILIISFVSGLAEHTIAHTWASSDWQESATGLAASLNEEHKTAGLGFVVQAQGWPFLSLQGGVKDSGGKNPWPNRH